MKVHLEIAATLAVRGARSGDTLEMEDGARAGDVLHRLQIPAAHQRAVALFVNNQRAHPTALLRDGDRVFLALPIGGG